MVQTVQATGSRHSQTHTKKGKIQQCICWQCWQLNTNSLNSIYNTISVRVVLVCWVSVKLGGHTLLKGSWRGLLKITECSAHVDVFQRAGQLIQVIPAIDFHCQWSRSDKWVLSVVLEILPCILQATWYGWSVLIAYDCIKALMTSVNMHLIYFCCFRIRIWLLTFIPPQKSTAQSPAVLHLTVLCVILSFSMAELNK